MKFHEGEVLGHYRLEEVLGVGGFASVFLATDLHLQRPVALKVLKERVVSPGERETFLREAQIVAQLRHRNIIQVYDFNVHEDIPFLVMDYAPGGHLRVPRGDQLLLVDILPYVQQVASALDYAHSHRLIHRDVKPENMLFGPDDEVLLSDFGLVRFVQSRSEHITGDVAGTAAYMAPEQVEGKPCFASDQYALGVVVYEWLTGDVPFQGETPLALFHQHVHAQPPSLRRYNPRVSVALDSAVLKALAKKPAQRYPSVGDFAEALAQASISAPSTAFRSGRRSDDHEADISTWVSPRQNVVAPSMSESDDDFSPPLPLKQRQSFDEQVQTKRLPSSRILRRPTFPPLVKKPGTTFSTVLANDEDSSVQQASSERRSYFPWLIIGSSALAGVLICLGILLQQPQIWGGGIVMALACIVLGLAQTFFLNQWYWFTLFLCFGPLIGLAYGLLSPIAEAAPPANLRQLILVSYLLGMLLFVSGVIVSMVANAVTILGLSLLYEGFVLLLNSYLLGLIRVTRLGLDFKEFVNPPVLSMFWAGFVSSIRDDGHDL